MHQIGACCSSAWRGSALASPVGRGDLNLLFWAERVCNIPSQSKIGSEEPIFASSPKGRAKAAFGGKQCDKRNFEILFMR